MDCGLGRERDRDNSRCGPHELLGLAKQMPNSPLADVAPDEVMLADGKLVSKRDASRAVSIADAMRHGGVDRIEQEKTTTLRR